MIETAMGRIGGLATALALLVALCASGAGAAAQDYPNRPITMIVPFPAGGPTDGVGRVMADALSRALGQRVIVENVAGAGGSTGTARAVRSAPDGYTILLNQFALATNATLIPNQPFDPATDLAGISPVNTSPSVLAGRKDLPPANMAELVPWLKAPGRHAKMASPGTGTVGHVFAILFAKALQIDLDIIPYRGGGPLTTDLLAGHVDLTLTSALTGVDLVQRGAIKGYGVTTKERVPTLPNVPSLVELGYPDFEMQQWHALFAPVGIPQPIMDRMSAAAQAVLAEPGVVQNFERTGTRPFPVE